MEDRFNIPRESLQDAKPYNCESVTLLKKSGVHTKGKVDLQAVVMAARGSEAFHEAGAMAIFVGVVRGLTKEGKRVSKLELEAYEDKANEALQRIARDLQDREGIVDVQIHHLLGEFEVGEEIVYVLVSGSHRANLLPVFEEAIERYKLEAPIFKKECILGKKGRVESRWIGEEAFH